MGIFRPKKQFTEAFPALVGCRISHTLERQAITQISAVVPCLKTLELEYEQAVGGAGFCHAEALKGVRWTPSVGPSGPIC
jgi:hypothetical protein